MLGPDYLAGGEARIVDGERAGVAHGLQGEIAPGDEPAVERRQPRHRLALAQARQQRMRIGCELLEGGRRADGERGLSTLSHRAKLPARLTGGISGDSAPQCDSSR